MNLTLIKPSKDSIQDFSRQVLELIKLNSKKKIDINAKLYGSWNEYLKTLFPNLNKSLNQIYQLFFKNQILIEGLDKYIITVNKNIKVDGIPLDLLANIINYGTLDMKGLNTFDKEYSLLADLIPSLYDTWRL